MCVARRDNFAGFHDRFTDPRAPLVCLRICLCGSFARLPEVLPAGSGPYTLSKSGGVEPDKAALAWALGCYTFEGYKSKSAVRALLYAVRKLEKAGRTSGPRFAGPRFASVLMVLGLLQS